MLRKEDQLRAYISFGPTLPNNSSTGESHQKLLFPACIYVISPCAILLDTYTICLLGWGLSSTSELVNNEIISSSKMCFALAATNGFFILRRVQSHVISYKNDKINLIFYKSVTNLCKNHFTDKLPTLVFKLSPRSKCNLFLFG